MFAGKKALVCGLARSGRAAIKLLQRHGADVTGTDTRSDIKGIDGARLRLGVQPDGFLHEYDLVVVSPGISCMVSVPSIRKWGP